MNSSQTPESMTIQEQLTAEFSELDRVTPRPLTHKDYAIAAIQFYQELGNIDLQPIVTEQQQTIEYQHDKLSEQEVKIEQLQKHLNETDDALHVAINLRKYGVKILDEAHDKNLDLLRENALLSADRDLWKDRYGKLVVEARHADEDEIKGLRYAVEHQALQTKEYKRLYEEYKERYEFAVEDGTDLRSKLEQIEDFNDNLRAQKKLSKKTLKALKKMIEAVQKRIK